VGQVGPYLIVLGQEQFARQTALQLGDALRDDLSFRLNRATRRSFSSTDWRSLAPSSRSRSTAC